MNSAGPPPFPSSTGTSPRSLDLRVVARAVWPYLLLWPLGVTLAFLLAAPAVICLTPFAWLLSVPVGRYCKTNTRSQSPSAEAAIAGAFLGISQGLVALAVVHLVSPYGNPYAQQSIFAAAVLTLLGSASACAIISSLSAGLRLPGII